MRKTIYFSNTVVARLLEIKPATVRYHSRIANHKLARQHGIKEDIGFYLTNKKNAEKYYSIRDIAMLAYYQRLDSTTNITDKIITKTPELRKHIGRPSNSEIKKESLKKPDYIKYLKDKYPAIYERLQYMKASAINVVPDSLCV